MLSKAAMLLVLNAVVCVLVVPTVSSISLKNRVENLELQLNSFIYQFRTDLKGLNDVIADLNSTIVANVGPVQVGPTKEIDLEKVRELTDQLENFINEQSKQMERFEIAFNEEKTICQQLAKKIKQGEQEENVKAKNDAKEIMEMLSERMDKEERERAESTRDMTEKMDRLSKQVTNLTDSLDMLMLGGSVSPMPRQAKPALPCPVSWQRWMDLCFLFLHNETVIWDVANMRCQDRGGILAEPVSKKAMLFLLDLGKTTGANVWLGLTDEETDGTWLTASSRKQPEYLQWERGQPNNWGGKQDCLEMYRGNLNDESCTADNKYVCQRNVYQE